MYWITYTFHPYRRMCSYVVLCFIMYCYIRSYKNSDHHLCFTTSAYVLAYICHVFVTESRFAKGLFPRVNLVLKFGQQILLMVNS